MKTINFGILGPGKISNRFADAFQYVPQAKVYAIASRDAERSETFAKTYNAEKAYSSYEDLLNDPAVDVVYIGTPHPFHYEQTLLCLKHYKPVLCEKPLALNLKQVKEMVDTARATKTFLMEAMWSRFFPAIHKALELIKAGVIGEIKYLQADFGFAAPLDMNNRVYNMALGGGAQLDVGIYPMYLALLVLGKPDGIKAYSHLASTGADATTGALFYYKSGAIAHIFSSIVTESPREGHIMGTKGSIFLHPQWHKTQQLTLKLNSGEVTSFPFPHSGNGFEFQVEEVARCIAAKQLECELMPLSMSLLMAETHDEIRRQGGIKYSVD